MFKKSTYKLISVAVIFVLIFTSISAVSAAETKSTDAISQDLLNSTAKVFVETKVNLMTDLNDNCTKEITNVQIKSNDYDKEKMMIVDYRNKLSSLGEKYSDSKTELEILSQSIGDDGNLHVIAEETTMLTMEGSDAQTGYSAKHEFVYSKENNEWKLIEDRQLEPTGLLPLYQAEEFVYNYEDSDSALSDEIGLNNDKNVPLGEDVSEPEIEASTVKPTNSNFAEAKNEKIEANGGYNYKKMANYLEKYWKNYNPEYRDFSGKGGDCTNFVSQALKAGGWKEKSGYYKNSNYWWYNFFNQTYSWSCVDYLGSFARSSGRCKMLDNVWKLRIGDFLQVKAKNSSQKTHSMMVSYFKNGTPYFTYHSSNRYRRSMNQVLSDWPGGKYYAYRT